MNIIDEEDKFKKIFEKVVKDGLKKAKINIENGTSIDQFYEYPIYVGDFEKSKMPNFHTTFFSLFNDNVEYRDYSSLFRNYVTKKDEKIDIGSLNGIKEFIEFIENNKKLKEMFSIIESEFKYSFLYMFISDFIGKYIFKYGTKYTKSNYNKLLFPVLNCLFSEQIKLYIIVPILLLQFEQNSYKINENIKIVKMNNEIQLSRYKIGADRGIFEKIVKGCATHALALDGYTLEYPSNNYWNISDALSKYNSFPLFIINSFFISLFLETGIYNGYEQVISMPKNWVLYMPDGNLINMHGTTANMYPLYLENGTWNYEVTKISIVQLKKVKKIFNNVINCNNKQIEMAIDRLIRALIRDNKEDAFLDILIGIEILLTDNEKTEVTYKLAMRISFIMNKINKDIDYRKILKDLYAYRSAIVHGNVNKQKFSYSKYLDKSCYNIALDIFSKTLRLIILDNKLTASKNIPLEIDNMIINSFIK